MVRHTRMLVFLFFMAFVNMAFASNGEARKPDTKDSEPINYAQYTFSIPGRGGMHHGYNAGAYVTLEVSQDRKSAQRINFRITNLIPEPWSRIGSIGFDLGRHTNLFSRLEPDKFIGQYYRLTYFPKPYTHAFWPDFNAYYYLSSTLDPRIAKPKDPRHLAPGSSLTITATLNPGIRYEDVISALNQGLKTRDGLRVAIIGLHLAGQPLPGGTRMDDGGYFTGRLVRVSGPHVTSTAPIEVPQQSVRRGEHESTPESIGIAAGAAGKIIESNVKPQAVAPEKTPDVTEKSSVTDKQAAPTNSPTETNLYQTPTRARNPWCRFCPDSSEK